MPKEKMIKLQSMSLTPPFPITEIRMNMYEYAKETNKTIQQALKILEEPEKGALSYDHSITGNTYRMQKLASDQFALWDVQRNTIKVLSSQETISKLFEHMPYVDLVGTELRMDLLKELADRKKQKPEI